MHSELSSSYRGTTLSIMYIIGIDGGGTQTIGILATEAGQHLEKVQFGPSNYHVVGEAETQKVLTDVINKLYEKSDVPLGSSVQFCLGMAGLGRPEDQKVIGQICDEIGIGKNRILTHDAHIALVGGTEKREGVIVISGTGAIAYGINADGKEARASGWGYLLGDEGSGYDIGIKGCRAVARATDGRGDPTELTNRILNRLELNEPTELVRWVHTANRDTIAQLAAIVFDAARSMDTVAECIVAEAADELVCAAVSVIKQLKFVESFDIVLSGGNFIHQAMFADKCRCRFTKIHPKASVQLPKHEPVYGAVLLAQASL